MYSLLINIEMNRCGIHGNVPMVVLMSFVWILWFKMLAIVVNRVTKLVWVVFGIIRENFPIKSLRV